MSDTIQRVITVTADLLKVDAAKITPESAFVDDLGAESVQTIELIAAFEEEFEIELDEEAALQIRTVADAAKVIDEEL